MAKHKRRHHPFSYFSFCVWEFEPLLSDCRVEKVACLRRFPLLLTKSSLTQIQRLKKEIKSWDWVKRPEKQCCSVSKAQAQADTKELVISNSNRENLNVNELIVNVLRFFFAKESLRFEQTRKVSIESLRRDLPEKKKFWVERISQKTRFHGWNPSLRIKNYFASTTQRVSIKAMTKDNFKSEELLLQRRRRLATKPMNICWGFVAGEICIFICCGPAYQIKLFVGRRNPRRSFSFRNWIKLKAERTFFERKEVSRRRKKRFPVEGALQILADFLESDYS